MEVFVVAIEYRGAQISATGPHARVGVREHAYELGSASLVGHPPEHAPRVGFPVPPRAWNGVPEFSRCAICDLAVEQVLRVVIRSIVATLGLPP